MTALNLKLLPWRKPCEDFQNSSKRSMIDANVFSNGGEVRRLPISRWETLNILQFHGNSYKHPRRKRTKVRNSSGLA